jgi:hypothetical protein
VLTIVAQSQHARADSIRPQQSLISIPADQPLYPQNLIQAQNDFFGCIRKNAKSVKELSATRGMIKI